MNMYIIVEIISLSDFIINATLIAGSNAWSSSMVLYLFYFILTTLQVFKKSAYAEILPTILKIGILWFHNRGRGEWETIYWMAS